MTLNKVTCARPDGYDESEHTVCNDAGNGGLGGSGDGDNGGQGGNGGGGGSNAGGPAAVFNADGSVKPAENIGALFGQIFACETFDQVINVLLANWTAFFVFF